MKLTLQMKNMVNKKAISTQQLTLRGNCYDT